MQWATVAAMVALGYLIGAIPFSFLVAKTQGVDLRKVGSGNTGASNVWRACGFRFFVIALALDIAKGFVPVALAYRVVGISPMTSIGIGLAAVLGHIYPVFMSFRGGKAVATTGGVLFAMEPILLLISALLWTIIYRLSGYPSVASLAGIVILAAGATAMTMAGRLDVAITAFIWVSLVIVFYMHRANIERLMRGTENRIGKRAK